MKLYQYLTENRSQSITQEKFNDLLQKNCSDILKIYENSSDYIYRGLSSNNNYIYIDPTKSVRKSRNTQNYYTILFDEILPSWKNYPKRSKSIICATNERVARSYGSLYKVYPFNGNKIGKAPRTDIWLSFYSSFDDDLTSFNLSLREISSYFYIELLDTKQSIISFAKELDEIKHKYKDLHKDEKLLNKFSQYHLIMDYLQSKKSFINFIDDLLSAEKNGFSHYTTSNLKLNPNKEMWIEGECLMKLI